MFGHIVQLNFNKAGSYHKTFIGGAVSFFIKITCFVFIIVRGRTIFTHSDDDYCSVEYLITDDDYSFSMSEASLMLTPSVNKIRNGLQAVDYDDQTVKSFIEMRYIQKTIHKNPKENLHQVSEEKPFSIKKCSKKDYIDLGVDNSASIFEANKLNSLQLYCPDLTTFKGEVKLQGSSSNTE